MNDTNFNADSNSDLDTNYNPNKTENQNSVFNVRVKAGSRRTYFFDVKTNKKGDYFIIITERRKRFDDDKAFDKNKIFLYKEDFNKFVKGLSDSVDHVKTELMPDFDFSVFDRDPNKSTNIEGQHEYSKEKEDGEIESPKQEKLNFDTKFEDNDTL